MTMKLASLFRNIPIKLKTWTHNDMLPILQKTKTEAACVHVSIVLLGLYFLSNYMCCKSMHSKYSQNIRAVWMGWYQQFWQYCIFWKEKILSFASSPWLSISDQYLCADSFFFFLFFFPGSKWNIFTRNWSRLFLKRISDIYVQILEAENRTKGLDT